MVAGRSTHSIICKREYGLPPRSPLAKITQLRYTFYIVSSSLHRVCVCLCVQCVCIYLHVYVLRVYVFAGVRARVYLCACGICIYLNSARVCMRIWLGVRWEDSEWMAIVELIGKSRSIIRPQCAAFAWMTRHPLSLLWRKFIFPSLMQCTERILWDVFM